MSYKYVSLLAIIACMATVFLATCGKDSPTKPQPPDPPEPSPPIVPVATRIEITPSTAVLNAIGRTIQLAARVFDQNNSAMAGVTVTWQSSDASVAAVNAQGLVTAVGNGVARITVRAGSASSGIDVTVMQSAGRVVITPEEATLMSLGATVQLTATVLDDNDQQVEGAVVTWQSSDASVAAVNAQGLVTAVGNGVARITVRAGSASSGIDVTVMQPIHAISLSPPSVMMVVGDTLRISAEATDNNGNVIAGVAFEWNSSNPGVASVDAMGLVTARKGGNVTITVSSAGVHGSAEVYVTPRQDDRAELVAFYHATNGPDWIDNTGWLTAAPLNTWFGVYTSDDGRVESLTLENNNLSGMIPEALFNLSELRFLQLGQNRLSGPIPPEIEKLVNLEGLELYANLISGQIPKELGNLVNASWIFLGFNQLTGQIPPELANLTNLNKLTLRYNKLTGRIPRGLLKLKLDHLDLSNAGVCAPTDIGFSAWLEGIQEKQVRFCNDLQRDVLIALYHATDGPNWKDNTNWLTESHLSEWYGVTLDDEERLRQLNLENNNLKGPLFPEIGSLEHLTSLNLSSNKLFGTIPSSLGGLFRLEELDLSRNNLGDELPLELNLLESLEVLRLEGTQTCAPLNVAFQEWLGGIPNHQVENCINLDRRILLTLFSNTGGPNWTNRTGWDTGAPLDEWYGVVTDDRGLVTKLDLDNNNLEGYLPHELGGLPGLSVLNLSSNGLSGTIPFKLTGLDLDVLDLGETRLCASPDERFQAWLQGIESVQVNTCSNRDREALIAIYDGLNGPSWNENTHWKSNRPLRSWFGVQTDDEGRVVALDIHANSLWGALPPEIGNLGHLQYLDLSASSLEGSIPAEIGNLQNLRTLNLENTGLTGSLPPTLGSLAELLVLRLSLNKFSGSIPSTLGNLRNLRELYLNDNRLTGGIPAAMSDLGELVYLHLHNNHLSGTIPGVWDNLSNLEELFLSGNRLSGSIPFEMGSLYKLQKLFLSHNMLSGDIPETLQNLSLLEILRLSNNSLSGEVPAFFGELDKLEYLFLDHNELGGAIPEEFGDMSRLRSLYLGHNNIMGPVPASLGNLKALRELRLDHNKLSGTLSAELGSLRNLHSLIINDNEFHGMVPFSFVQLGRLQELALHETNLCLFHDDDFALWLEGLETAIVPPSCVDPDRETLIVLFDAMDGRDWHANSGWLTENPIGDWHGVSVDDEGRVTSLLLNGNNLNGTIPSEIQVLTAIETLDLGGNSLSGFIPSDLGNLVSLINLNLSDNMLSGVIPSKLGELVLLESLDLSGNDLGGRIPTELRKLIQLDRLSLEDTRVCVPVGDEVETWLEGIANRHVEPCGMTDREALAAIYYATDGPNWKIESGWLSDQPMNTWTGVKTNENGRVTSLSMDGALGMNGSLPPEIGNLEELRFLYILGSPFLTGSLPPELGKLNNLEFLAIQICRITGSIPPELGNLSNLETMSLSSNDLSETVPKELGKLHKLKSMNLSGNSLSGTLPAELSGLSELQDLFMDHNDLSGQLPPEWGGFANLRDLNIGSNNLSGPIPPEWGNFANIRELVINSNSLTGSVPPELGNLATLQKLFLYENRISGQIPAELGKLKKLVTLNLRHNMLSGPIPAELANLSSLENLYLNDNQLSGSVPAGLGDLEALNNLGLFNNELLAGPLPAALTNLNLLSLQLGGTALCAPGTPEFRSWLYDVGSQRVPFCKAPMKIEAYLVQAVQSLDYVVPLVADEPALLRVFITQDEDTGAAMPPVRATFYHAGSVVHEVDIASNKIELPSEVDESQLSSSVNVEIPSFVVKPGLEMAVEVDPGNTLSNNPDVNRRSPETGRAFVDVLDVPALELTIVPTLWLENPDRSVLARTAGLTADDELFRLTRDILPVRDLSIYVRDEIWTSVEPILENGNEVLREVEATRSLDGMGGYYIGTLTSGGGIARISGTVSASVLRDDIIAHELGHNFSLTHAPCGRPLQIDPFFPYNDGSIGAWGYDMQSGNVVPPDIPDLMSYCGPPKWISDYNFGQLVRYRSDEEPMIAVAPTSAARSLLIWGGMNEYGELELEPAFVVDSGSSLPGGSGPYRISGEDAAGGEIFSFDFEMGEVADAEGGIFTFVIPVDPSWRERLDRIVLAGPEGVVVQDSNTDTASVLLRDSATGQVRGFMRDVPAGPSGALSARRSLPEPGLEMTISRGIPDFEDW